MSEIHERYQKLFNKVCEITGFSCLESELEEIRGVVLNSRQNGVTISVKREAPINKDTCFTCGRKIKGKRHSHIDYYTGEEIYICDDCQDSIDIADDVLNQSREVKDE